MDDGAECVDRFAVHQNVKLDQWGNAILRFGVIE